MTGWGLGITEIGRTGISNPYNCSRRGYQANPQRIIKILVSNLAAEQLRGWGAAAAFGPIDFVAYTGERGDPSGNLAAVRLFHRPGKDSMPGKI